MVNDPKIAYRVHATLRMAEHGISRAEVEEVIARGETIEDYPEDKPYPSRLMLATVRGRPIHAVVAWNEEDREWIVITVYEPSPTEWDPEFNKEDPMKCVICKTGKTTDGTTTITIEKHHTVLVLRGVPARVCQTCGEAYVSGEVTDEILRRADEMQRQGVEVDIRRFAMA